MPWRGPEYRGEFPTLGYLVGEWIEANLIVPDRDDKGKPYLLTDEQWQHLLWVYRLKPDADPKIPSRAFAYYGSILVRPQKWGKDPFAASMICAQALGPVRFDGWDADGEPVGRPVATPIIQCVANSEEQAPVTFQPVYTMLTEGPLAGYPGLDVGLTRINLPQGGEIKAVSSSARSRLGARLTFASFTETHLFTESTGGIEVARAMKRNLAGMGGRWIEVTNAWDPSEQSVAQRTVEARAPGVYLDYRPPRQRIDLDDDAAVMEELRYVYGDSTIERGGWVDVERLLAERGRSTGEGEFRRFFLNEITVGSRDAVDALRWANQVSTNPVLAPAERVTLGFHGSINRDATSLCAARLSDGCLFHLASWQRPHGFKGEWVVPRAEVDQAVKNAFEAYDVVTLMASPHGWQTEVNEWAGQYDKVDGEAKVLEIWLNQEHRMDQLVERFTTAHRDGEVSWDGSGELQRAALGAALANGKRRSFAEEREPGAPEHYQKIVRKSLSQSVSAFMAALLAYEARGWAIEHGELANQLVPSIW